MAMIARWRIGGVLVMLSAALGACASTERQPTDQEINAYPANYKADIAGAMRAYLLDPTKIRDASVSEPMRKEVSAGGTAAAVGIVPKHSRYIVCVRFNAKKSNSGDYAGMKENVAVFLAGRLDQFIPAPREMCKDAVYQPFPELGTLSR